MHGIVIPLQRKASRPSADVVAATAAAAYAPPLPAMTPTPLTAFAHPANPIPLPSKPRRGRPPRNTVQTATRLSPIPESTAINAVSVVDEGAPLGPPQLQPSCQAVPMSDDFDAFLRESQAHSFQVVRERQVNEELACARRLLDISCAAGLYGEGIMVSVESNFVFPWCRQVLREMHHGVNKSLLRHAPSAMYKHEGAFSSYPIAIRVHQGLGATYRAACEQAKRCIAVWLHGCIRMFAFRKNRELVKSHGAWLDDTSHHAVLRDQYTPSFAFAAYVSFLHVACGRNEEGLPMELRDDSNYWIRVHDLLSEVGLTHAFGGEPPSHRALRRFDPNNDHLDTAPPSDDVSSDTLDARLITTTSQYSMYTSPDQLNSSHAMNTMRTLEVHVYLRPIFEHELRLLLPACNYYHNE